MCIRDSDRGDRASPLGLLALGDEPQVVAEQGGIHDQEQAMLIADGAQLAQVGQGMRLSANQVGAGLEPHERDVLDPHLSDQVAQPAEIQVALERVGAGHVQGGRGIELLDPAAAAGADCWVQPAGTPCAVGIVLAWGRCEVPWEVRCCAARGGASRPPGRTLV